MSLSQPTPTIRCDEKQIYKGSVCFVVCTLLQFYMPHINVLTLVAMVERGSIARFTIQGVKLVWY